MHEGHRERLRSRYCNQGLEGFEDHEILELLLTYTIPRKNTNDTAHALIAQFGSIERALMADISELQRVPGIGESTAVFLRLHGDIVRRLVLAERLPLRSKNPRLHTPAAAASYALSLFAAERYECVYVASLNKNLQLLHAQRLLTGTLTEAPLYPRRVVESALQNGAHAILLLHNHPSGDPSPSENDLEATEAVKLALNSIDIHLHDHLIAGSSVVYSCLRGILIEPAATPDGQPLRVRFPAEQTKKPPAAEKLAAERDPH